MFSVISYSLDISIALLIPLWLITLWFITLILFAVYCRMRHLQNDLLEGPTLERKDLLEILLKQLFDKLTCHSVVGSLVVYWFAVVLFSFNFVKYSQYMLNASLRNRFDEVNFH